MGIPTATGHVRVKPMTITIRGRVVQKIPPKRLDWYVEPWYGFIPGKWHVTILKQGVPKGGLRRFFYANVTHRKKAREEGTIYHVALDDCPYKKGELVEFQVEPHVIETPLLVAKRGKRNEFKTVERTKGSKRQGGPAAVP